MFKVTSCPAAFAEKDFVNEQIAAMPRSGDVLTFLKGHFNRDVRDIHERHNHVSLTLYSVSGGILIDHVTAKAPAAKAKTKKKK